MVDPEFLQTVKNLWHMEMRNRGGATVEIAVRANPEVVTIQKEEHRLDTNPKGMGVASGQLAGCRAYESCPADHHLLAKSKELVMKLPAP